MAQEFTHLHLHSQYSLLDGAIKMKDVVERSLALGMKSVAVTDHGNMFGAVDFYKRAKASGIKPIMGCEAYIAGNKGANDKTERKAFHLILLAKNQEGYQNIKKLISKAYLDGYYYHPRVDKAWLREHSKGLYALSACLGGEVSQRFMKESSDIARATAREYAQIFEPGHFHLELQDNKTPEQLRVNTFFKELSRDEGIPLVATNDAHYLHRADAKAHEVLMCIQTGATLNDGSRMRHSTDELFLKSPAEMWASETYQDCQEALHNTMKIANDCNVDLELGKVFLPDFKVPPEFKTRELYLEHIAKKGLETRLKEARYPCDRARYYERIEYELGVINQMGFAGYFLIVWDFIGHAKRRGVPVGPGRGSGAGSIVAYSLRITDLDPIPYDLLFERFLNPERVSMPDFDIDFCQDRRGEVIEYVTAKYGHENVAQIITFSQLSAKSVIKDVARVMGVPFQEANEITKLIPGLVDGKKLSLDKAIEMEPRLRSIQEERPVFKDIINVARNLEGLNRNAGIHAAGIVIGDLPLEHYVPLYRGVEKVKDPVTGKEVERIFRVTQFAKDEVEQAGLVKFDFLGLKTLTVIDHAVKLINRRIDDEKSGKRPHTPHPHATEESTPHLDLLSLAFDDPGVYELCSAGTTDGVFQMESSGFKELLRRLRPDRFEDIIAAGALYRPGPLDAGLVDDYIERKHGRRRISYLHPSIESILQPTYGVIVYQEQVMLIAVKLCGFTMGQADTLRKAMGKKNPEVMAKMRASFVDGAIQKSGLARDVADEFFSLIEKFAGYAFNKSHSAAYAVLTYQTAYLKRHYPVEFMAALLSTEMGSTDNIVKYVTGARDMGIAVLPPDVNHSERGFSAPGEQIRFGLGAIKGIGDAVIDVIIKARQDKPFSDLFDFCERVDGSSINKKSLEALVESGAFDSFGIVRARLFHTLEKAYAAGSASQRDRKSGQESLFGLLAAPPKATPKSDQRYPDLHEWDDKEKLRREKSALGFFLSAHPLDRYREDLKRLTNTSTAELDQRRARSDVTLAGVITTLREKPLKDGSGRMAFASLEDAHGTCEVIVFSKAFALYESILKSDEPILVRGKVVMDGDEESAVVKVRLESAELLSKVRFENTQSLDMTVSIHHIDPARLERIRTVIHENRGDVPLKLWLVYDNGIRAEIHLPRELTVAPTEQLAAALERIFDGERIIKFN